MKIIKDNLTDIIDWLTNPEEDIPQSKLDDLDKTPSNHPNNLLINDEGEVIELGEDGVMNNNNFTTTIKPQCYVIPDKYGNVRFVFVSKKFKIKKTDGEGYKLNK